MKEAVSILIVDDDDDVRAALVDELARDYRVEAAACAEEAFAALAARTYDVVISDLKMPDHDGIEVLDFARDQDPEIIRILLTGYVDERAHRALLKPDAPFKVGKPWYDEIDVVLRRALEQRHRARQLASSLDSAIGLGEVDQQLACVDSLDELAEVVALRVARIAGVDRAWALAGERPLVGAAADAPDGGWRIDRAVDPAGRVVVGAIGTTATAHGLVEHVLSAAHRRAGTLAVTAAAPTPVRSRIDELMRHATIGTLTATLLHDIASLLQVVDAAVQAIAAAPACDDDPDVRESAADVAVTAREALDLFVATRKFLSEGIAKSRKVALPTIVQRILRHAGGAVRERARLATSCDLDFELELPDTLFVRSLADLLASAASLAPQGCEMRFAVTANAGRVTFTITDDGPGVEPALVPALFEPMAWNRPAKLPIRLAIAAYTLRSLGATVSYHRGDPGGGCFTVEVPRAPSS